MSRACVSDLRGERVRYPSPQQKSTWTRTNDSQLPNHVTVDDYLKGVQGYGIEGDTNFGSVARVDPVPTRVNLVLTRGDLVFAVTTKV